MKINAINSVNYMTGGVSFKHVAVPYPEYEDAYYVKKQDSSFNKIAHKISALFTPEVTQKSKEIKEGINKIYEAQELNLDNNPNEHLLSVLA